jgi:hypothetical protein
MNELNKFADVLDRVARWHGVVPAGYVADFLGTFTATDFLRDVSRLPDAVSLYGATANAAGAQLAPPTIGDGGNGERWFEAVNWIIAAREARDRYVMVSLGAFYGYQAVASQRAIAMLNPMPCKLVCVEPLAEKIGWIRRHMRDNQIDPDRQWLVQAALGGDNEPVLFPVGAATIGGHNCVSTNDSAVRKHYLDALRAEGRCEQVLSDILLRNSTGIIKNIVPGRDFAAEIRFVSCVTLNDVLGPFDFVDYLEADLQQSEVNAFPPALDLLRRKVRRLHIGTHGADVHAALHQLFAERGWQIVFSYLPDSRHESPLGPFTTLDGVLTVRNPAL